MLDRSVGNYQLVSKIGKSGRSMSPVHTPRFAAVLDAETTGKAEVHNAPDRLEQCRATMKAALYKDILEQLRAKP